MSKCKNYCEEFDCCKVFSDFSNPMTSLQPCIESPCKYYKPQTNFDKITESVESLAEFIDSLNLIDCNAKEVFIKWLQKEIDYEEDK